MSEPQQPTCFTRAPRPGAATGDGTFSVEFGAYNFEGGPNWVREVLGLPIGRFERYQQEVPDGVYSDFGYHVESPFGNIGLDIRGTNFDLELYADSEESALMQSET